MAESSDKVRVGVGSVSLELPAGLAARQETGVDSPSKVFEGGGLTVIVDQGPFADRLERYAGRPDYREEARIVGGAQARVVSFRSSDQGGYTVAVHFAAPIPATIVVNADASVPLQIPTEIIESVAFLE